MKIILGLFALLLVIVVGGKLYTDHQNGQSFSLFSKTPTATINNQKFNLFLAKSQKETGIGLSEKTSLAQDYGMLFIFPSADYVSFWMKNMKFPIDIIFINDTKVVTVFDNLQPAKNNENPPTYNPQGPANKVLEINAGLSKKYNIKNGDEIKFSNL